MKSEVSKNLSLVVMVIAFVLFVYGTVKALDIVNRTQVGTSKGIYTSYVSTSKEIQDKAHRLTRNCKSKLCKVQTLLNFASKIPYRTNTFQQCSPHQTMQQNFGDCDDKSNLLISLLHSLKIEAYFVLVPKHIFVIVPLENSRLSGIKGLWVKGKKYYILESTAKNSSVGYPLHYALDEIDVIIEPFGNQKMDIRDIKFHL